MEIMKTFLDVEVMLPSKWAAKFRPKAFRPAVVGDWVFSPIAGCAMKLTADHEGSLGVCHLILEPMAPDPKEWWPRWLKARWLFGGKNDLGDWVWFVSNLEEPPTAANSVSKPSCVSWGYYLGKLKTDLPINQWMTVLMPRLFDLSFIPEVEPKDACFKNPWLDEPVRQINAGVAYERTENAS